MFQKVLVVDDIDSVSYAVKAVLKDLQIVNVYYTQYCDKAWLQYKAAIQNNMAYDLLICDLSFKDDHRNEKLKDGSELISKILLDNSAIKVIVNSIEDHPQVIHELWEKKQIDAYVCKDRNGMKELKKAIKTVAEGNRYLSAQLQQSVKQENVISLSAFEMKLLTGLAQGMTQDEIEAELKLNNIKPNSKSSIEKRLKELREDFDANTNPHLISIIKDLRLI